MTIMDFFPPTEVILTLEPEELAIPLLNAIANQEQSGNKNNLILENFIGYIMSQPYPEDRKVAVGKSITEAWMWLSREGMIAPLPREGGLIYITRKGAKLRAQGDIAKYIKSNIIPKESLDPILADKVLPLFIRGDYDIAVFQAFKEVEIRVRRAASLSQEMIGVELMRKAFHSEEGALTNMTRPKPEREATAHLFAGAIGLFKNPSSHRNVDWEDPVECAELIYLANHLLRIVEKHRSETENSE